MQDFIDAFVVTFVVTFLLGSIPFGLIISKVFYKTDIREHGSGNIGTTNAIRTMGKVGGYSVFVLDFGKGLLSGFLGIWIGQLFFSLHGYGALASDLTAILAPFRLGPVGDPLDLATQFSQVLLAVSFLGCVWGHIFSPWLKFKGGKGIAVAVGCLFVTFGVVGAVLELAIFIVLVVATRYVSVGSIAAALACPFFSLYFFWGDWLAFALCSLAGLTVVWAHRENIKRLLSGTENRVGSKKKA
ncbi:glycerol-3-phosphate 1-O-acyltransferase PlsY [Raoultibacter timonensis]|uniref:Glycerol-3-phosphate acyltransferase n=1 Tax=Raoultibacter timonensis TaxID=1907662 RepID=A0ABN6MDY9_9ACTN|nr:glycerol-3-phosphate 1-O-acyltransferase PlsY [Raoultibacter timonensis]BDE96202.1 glycerol-3-phosphate acyltransferase [Raoultibacter timonensis]BDF50807.1 glycerol-3-phosphate acyltransferase [Raoultibacter timonensis]